MIWNDRDGEERYKTQFETNRSSGVLSPKRRSEAEARGLGAPTTLDPKLRPVSGYLHVPGSRPDNYGSISLVLADHVKARTTITIGDSLFMMHTGSAVGTPLLNPGLEGVDGSADSLFKLGQGDEITCGYIETQIQGGFTMGEVEKVIFCACRHTRAGDSDIDEPFASPGVLKPEYQKIADEMKRRGIQVEYDEYGRK